MNYIKKKVAAWEIRFGQIGLSGKDNVLGRELFEGYFGKTFTLKTPKGDFREINFNEKSLKNSLRLACSSFFKKLNPEDVIYISPGDSNSVIISNAEPTISLSLLEAPPSKFSEVELYTLVASLTKENMQLRETNSNLFQYKDRLDKFETLQRIFDDETFMENWLERNIHKAIADLEIIERQPSVSWPNSKLRNRMDFFCLDRTTREFVVVENKIRGNTNTIETQYLSYKAWVKDNLDTINKRYEHLNLKATADFRFVIIIDRSDERIETICRDNKIALIVIDGGVLFEEIVPYSL